MEEWIESKRQLALARKAFHEKQRKWIEEKRQAALAKLALKQAQQAMTQINTIAMNQNPYVAIRQGIEAMKVK